jgi:hypothetical protein
MGVHSGSVRPYAMSRWLATLPPDELAAILLRRPEATTAPVPRTLGDLAGRLNQHNHVAEAVITLCAPAVQLLEVVQALLDDDGESVARADIAALVGYRPDSCEINAALEVLYQRALAWPVGDRVVVAGPLRHAFAYPLQLGRRAALLLGSRPVDEVRRIGAKLGAGRLSARKRELVEAVAARLADPAVVRKVVAEAPPALRSILDVAARETPAIQGEYGYLPPGLEWAVERGLLVIDGWEFAEMPREVAEALRGPGALATFDPHPPLPPLPVADPAAVAREAAAAVAAVLGGVTAVVDAAPIAPLKAGGVGVREIKRLARATGIDEAGVGLLLDLAGAAGLVSVSVEEVLPTPEYDAWAGAPPAERLATLIRAWLDLGTVRRPGTAPLRPEFGTPGMRRLRPTLLGVLGDIAGALPADGSLVYPLLAWHAPLALDAPPEDAVVLAQTLWREATTLGLVAHGALSPLGRAALDGSDLVAAASALVAAPAERAVFQADLTAVVAGTPSVDVSRLLDGCADREARGTASVWRFTPASVRRALDAGLGADDLVERLRGLGTVPQALEYLVGDVARRHGALRVRAVGCVLHGADPALLSEVAADRKLTGLGLATITPTVLVSTRPPAETLAALRAAGYAPMAEDTGGALLVEVPPQRRAEQPVARRLRRSAPVRPPDAQALAAKLLAAGTGPDRPAPAARRASGPARGQTELFDSVPTIQMITEAAPRLGGFDTALLAGALLSKEAVRIVYLSAEGHRSERTIEPVEIEEGYLLRAYCHLRADERFFALSRIQSVRPA